MDWSSKKPFDMNDYEKFSYGDYPLITAQVVKLMILKSEYLMNKYLY